MNFDPENVKRHDPVEAQWLFGAPMMVMASDYDQLLVLYREATKNNAFVVEINSRPDEVQE